MLGTILFNYLETLSSFFPNGKNQGLILYPIFQSDMAVRRFWGQIWARGTWNNFHNLLVPRQNLMESNSPYNFLNSRTPNIVHIMGLKSFLIVTYGDAMSLGWFGKSSHTYKGELTIIHTWLLFVS